MADPIELTDEVKVAIVTALAAFGTPSAVAAMVRADFKLELTRQRVEAYDPTKVAGQGLGKHLKELFETARAAYLEDTASIGISHQVHRLQMLDRLAARAIDVGNHVVAMAAMEQAAKELGGAYTNTRKLTGPDGGAIRTKDETERSTPAQVMDDLRAIFGGDVSARLAAAAAEPGAAPEKPGRSDRPLRKGSRRRGAKKP